VVNGDLSAEKIASCEMAVVVCGECRVYFVFDQIPWEVNMFREIGVLMVSVMASGGALAEALECGAFNTAPDQGVYGDAHEVTATRSNVTPQLGEGYVVVGVRCDFKVYYGNPGVESPNGPTVLYWQRPIDGGNGISCKAGPEGIAGFVVTTATIFACRPHVPQGGHKSARVNNYGLGGDAVAVAKDTAGVVPFSVRLCNRTRSGGMGVDLGNATPTLAPDFCLEIDKPQRMFIRTQSQNVVVSATYALFKPGTFKAQAKVVPALPVDDGNPISPGPFKSMTAECVKPPAGEPFDAHYWGYCRMAELKDGKNYRVCFDNGYSNQGEGLEWYGGGLRVVTNHDLMNKPPQGGQLSPFDYMSTEPAGCRDMFGVKNAWLLLADPNNNWNDQSVSRVTYRYAEIPAP
jgi:hypothetical protein